MADVAKNKAAVEVMNKLLAENDTLPKILRAQVQKYGDNKIGMCKKILGIWVPYTWQEVFDHVKWTHLGLISLGVQPKDIVTIIGDNDPEYFWIIYAVQAARATACGMYVDSHYAEVKYVAGWTETKIAFAKDQEQVDKFLEVKDDLPNLQKLIYWESKGLWFYDYPFLMSFEELEDLGKKYEESHPGLFNENIDSTLPTDTACFLLSSGTTRMTVDGVARSQMGRESHLSLLANLGSILRVDPWYDTDVWLSYMSPAWAEQLFGVSGCLMAGVQINFPEEPETVTFDTRELGPQCLFYPSRLWESILATIMSKMSETGGIKKFCYELFMPVGYRMADFKFEGKEPNILWKALYKVADLISFRPLRDKVGLLGVRNAYTAGSLLGPDMFRYFRAIGVNLKQLYGSTEIGIHTLHLDNDIDPETVGKLLNQEYMKISPEGEILVRGSFTIDTYFKDEEEWDKMRDEEGWLHTGDSGYINEKNHLIFYDRMKDMVTLPTGRKFAPQYIESRLKFTPYIKDCMIVGGEDKPFVTAMINIDFECVSDFAESAHLAYTTFVDLSQKPQIYDLILKEVQRVNKYLPDDGKIKRFINMHKEFDPDEAELTRSRKLRRKFMEQRYEGLLQAIYSGAETYEIEAPVRYKDGRTSVIRTHINIKNVPDQ